jgi:serine/threonine protein kinase
MLKAFSNHQNPHMIKLLATYRYRGRYHLVFPYAKLNLRKYWKETPLPEFSLTTVHWMLCQCKGIATGLNAIHVYRNSSIRLQAKINATSLQPGPGPTEHWFGRHGDIKPENFLWSDENIVGAQDHHNELGSLLIADFGLMEFHGEQTRSRVKPESVVGSPTYAPPELALRIHISRAYDIWSLGCVFLEFITWLVLGWQELEAFPEARVCVFADGTSDDTFYTIKNEGSKPYGIVRPSVSNWIKKIHSAPRCSLFVHDFLELISKNMLVVNVDERMKCGLLITELATMLEKSKKDPEYLTHPVPWPMQEQPAVPEGSSSPAKRRESPPPSPTDGKALPRRPAASNLDALAQPIL